MRQLIYPAPPVAVGPPPAGHEEVVLGLEDGTRVIAWYYPATESSSSRPALLFFHGNGENLETMRSSGTLESLATLDAPYLALDYPGYGRSEGLPSEKVIKLSAQAALDWLADRQANGLTVVCGWSLGAAVAVFLAATEPERVDGLIAMSAWTSLADVASAHYPSWMIKLALREEYDSISVAADLRKPVLLIHGGSDSIIPAEQGLQLAEVAPMAEWIEIGPAGHNDLLSFPEVWDAMGNFLDDLKSQVGV